VDTFHASRGVRLFHHEADGFCFALAQALEVGGRDDTRYVPIVLPPIPSLLVERCAGLARALWRTSHAQMLIALYLGMEHRQWLPIVPQQTCDRDGVHCKFTGAGYPSMPADYRLAGTFRSALFDEVDLEAEIPAADGVHLLFDLESDWIRLGCCRRIDGRLSPARAEAVIQNDALPHLKEVAPQLRIGN
jgi:hypothetical protein